MIKRLLGMLIAMMLIAAMVVPATAEVKTMYVRTNTGISLHVRSSPNVTKNNIIGSLKYGEAVGVDHYLGNGWAEIVYGAKRGYVATRYLVCPLGACVAVVTIVVDDTTKLCVDVRY